MCRISHLQKILMHLSQPISAAEYVALKFQPIPMRDESTPTAPHTAGSGARFSGRDAKVNPLMQHSHQHPKLMLGWLVLVLMLLGGDVWSQPATAQKPDSASQKLLVVVQDFQEVRSGQRQLGQSDSDESLTARAYAALEKKHALPTGTLGRELPGFLQRLLLDPGTSDLDRARALYASRQLAECEKAALQAKDKATAAAGVPVPRAIEALLLAASSAEDQIKYSRALDHLRAAAALTSREREPLLWARVHHQMCAMMWATGDYREGSDLAQEVLRVREQQLGLEHLETLTSVNNLADLLYFKGDKVGAEPLFRRVLAVRQRMLGVEHPATLISVNNLGRLLGSKGDLAGAEPLFRRALAACERTLGAEHPDTLTSVNNLAILLFAKRDLIEAEPLFRRALAGRERVLGAEHLDTVGSINNLAALLNAKGDLTGAEPLWRRALTVYERVLGPEHPETLGTVNNLAGLMFSKGDLAGAEALYQRMLSSRERTLGEEHPDTLISVLSLAGIRHAQGRLEAAEGLAERAEQGFRTQLGAQHPRTKIAKDWLNRIRNERAEK